MHRSPWPGGGQGRSFALPGVDWQLPGSLRGAAPGAPGSCVAEQQSSRTRMNRRTAGLAVLRTVLALAAAPFAAQAQQPGKVYRIGYLSAPSRESVERGVEAFVRTLRELG